MNVKERLKIFIKYRNLSVSAFEKSISASNGYVGSINKSIGADKLDLIAKEFPELNISWLTRGEGEMIKDFYFLPGMVEGEKFLVYKDDSEEANEERKQTELIGKRLFKYSVNHGVSIKEFAAKCDIGYNNATSLLKGSLPMGMKVLQKIKKGFPNLNTDWVLFGNGNMELNNEDVSQQIAKEVAQLEQVNNLLSNTIKDKEKTISSLENQIALMEKLQEVTKTEESPIKSNVAQ